MSGFFEQLLISFVHLFMASHNDTGKTGEELALAYFLQLGYTMLHRNWRHSHWEIDLVLSRNDILHFVEVKCLRTSRFGYPEEKVNKRKLQHIMNAAEVFLEKNPVWKKIQFDVLSVILEGNNGKPEYFLIEDVYL